MDLHYLRLKFYDSSMSDRVHDVAGDLGPTSNSLYVRTT